MSQYISTSLVGLSERQEQNGHKPVCYWFTGLSGSGKSTLARQIEKQLFMSGKQVTLLDGDNLRKGINSDLGFSMTDRYENIRRIAHIARLMYDAGLIVLCSFISPRAFMRDYVRQIFPDGGFREIYLKCSLEECIRRDTKGLYKKAMEGKIENFTGISSDYEEPLSPEYVLDTERNTVEQCIHFLNQREHIH